uniref:Uncharacterized protein n=1 Tax=Alexandrium catenella TaxID=2925 RepID=A0A7S1RUF9_ALECA
MAGACLRSFALVAMICGVEAARSQTSLNANPIRRVVSMLQMMQKKITEESAKDKDLFDKFNCYCQTGAKDLEASVAAAEGKIPQVQSSLDEATAQKDQLEKDLDEHKQDRLDAKDALAQASGLREKEAAEFLKESSDDKANVAALGKAIVALEKGVTGFLQTQAATAVRRLTINMDLNAADRDMLASFLSQGEGYAPQSGQIIGILKQMKDTMEKDLAAIVAEEEKAKADYASLVAAKQKEVNSNTQAIEAKLGRHGQTGVKIETLKEDLEDTTKSLGEDKKFLADLDNNCAKKKEEWEAVQKTRTDELLALAETIKILNEDDALELFKKTLPSPSLLQTRASGREVRQRALHALRAKTQLGGGLQDPRLDFLALALRGKTVGFDKVLAMIDDMVALLGKEQSSDDQKKAYCEAEIDKNEDSKKQLDLAASDLEKAIEDAKGTIDTLTDEVAALEKGIKDLDAQVAEATENRKAEHAQNEETLASDQAAKEVLKMATNRLNKFYDPALYKPLAKRELSAEDRIYENMGGVVPTPAPAPTFMQLASSQEGSRGAPPPPPKAFEAYTKKGQEKSGVMEMIKMLVADLDKEMQEIEVEEKDAQAEYETLMGDSAQKRAADSQSLAGKERATADLEAELDAHKDGKKAATGELAATLKYISSLHGECDWLMQYFDVRKEARAGEVNSLKRAKAVLSGADYSL